MFTFIVICYIFGLLSVLFSLNAHANTMDMEPGQCLSRFDYDYKVLQKLLELESNIKELKDRKSLCEEKTPSAFMATLTDHIPGPQVGSTVVFDSVITNEGNGYSPATGVFGANVGGTYNFQLTASSPVKDLSTWAASCVTSTQIVSEARKHIGSTKWSYASNYSGRPNLDKYSLFIYDILKSVGAKQPTREWWIYTPYGPAGWGNPNSAELKDIGCWTVCWNSPRSSDVISDGKEVGFVTGFFKTTRAIKKKIEETDWGFRAVSSSGSTTSITGCWRYKYHDTTGC